MEKKICISGFFDNFSGEGKIARSQLQCRGRSMFSFQVGKPLHPHFVFQPKKLSGYCISLLSNMIRPPNKHPPPNNNFKQAPPSNDPNAPLLS